MTLTRKPAELVHEAEDSFSPDLLAKHPTWERVPLKDVAEVVNGCAFSSRFFNNHGNGVPLVRIRDVGQSRPITFYSGPFEDCYLVNSGDVLVGMDGDFRVSEWRGPVSLLNQRVCRLDIRDCEIYDKKFLELVLQGYLDAIWSATSSVTVKHLSSRSVQEIPLPLPPILEQRRIVDVVDNHLSHLDAAEYLLSSAVRRADTARKAVLAAALSGKLVESPDRDGIKSGTLREATLRSRRSLRSDNDKRGRPDALPPAPRLALSVPENWSIVSLEEATHPNRTISYGILKPGPNVADGVPYVRVINMRGDQIATEDLHRTSTEIDQKYARARLAPGDVLLSIRGTFGRVAVVPECLANANITQDTARLAFVETVEPRFAAYYLQTSEAQAHLKDIARGVAVKGVNIGDLREMPMPLPSLAEQKSIICILDEYLSEIAAAECAIRNAQIWVGRLRKAILLEAFMGKLVSQEPDDEPASILLGRIRVERVTKPVFSRARRTPKKPDEQESLL